LFIAASKGDFSTIRDAFRPVETRMSQTVAFPDPPPSVAASPAPVSVFDRQALLEKNLERQNQWIRSCDTKISMLLPINTALLAVLGSQLDGAHLAVHWLLVVATSVPSLISFGSSVMAAMPHLRRTGGSLIYFGDVARHTPDEYRAGIFSVTQEAHLKDLAEQVHESAQLAERKYRHVRVAYVALLIALPFWVAAIYLLNHSAAG
jgi:hypothetical protein